MKTADLAKRFVAAIIDSLALNFIINTLLTPLWCTFIFIPDAFTVRSSPWVIVFICLVAFLALVVVLLITYCYYVWVPVKKWGGATLGKRVMNIRVVRTNGSSVTQVDMIAREFIGKFISGVVCDLGYIWILIDDRAQGWHDKLADTLVIDSEERV